MSEIPPRLTGGLSGRYFLERELGQGWNATVYLAEDIRGGGQVAMKVVRPELSLVLDAEPFLEVIRGVMRLAHPRVLPVIDAGNSDGVLFYATPYVQAESLRDRLTRDDHLDLGPAVAAAHAVAEALDEAHQQGIVHGGLKPENVLFAPDGTLVADYAFDTALRRAARGRFAAREFLPRRPHYLSPERARFAEADVGSDIYALGCLVYEMLAAVPPFDGSSAEEVLQNILAQEPEPLGARRPDLPPHVVAAVHRALAREPRDRFPTAQGFVAAL
jgi:serine/threonine-protein kinase